MIKNTRRTIEIIPNSLEKLASSKQLMAFLHKGFWYCMDTPRDKDNLNEIWRKKNVPWKKW